MRVTQTFLAGVASELPSRQRTSDAVADGRLAPELADELDIAEVAVSEGAAPAELAAAAARTALIRAGTPAAAVRLVLHADVWYQGQDLWAPASYVQRVAVGNRCPAVEVRQLSNGGMVSLELGARVLATCPPGAAAVLTTGDVFHEPGFDRWHSDPGTVYGDSGTAAVLSTEDGFASLLSVVTVSDPELEGMHRGDDPFGTEPFSVRKPLDLRHQQRAFLSSAGATGTVARVAAGQQEAVEQALKDADLTFAEIDWFVLPHFGKRRLRAGYLVRWGIHEANTTWRWARTIGHLGAGDQFAGLDHLVSSGLLRAGAHCLLAGVGAGFSWSAAVVRVDRVPRWPAQRDSGGFPAGPVSMNCP